MVTGLTLGALAVVGLLAAAANGAETRAVAGRTKPAAPAGASPSTPAAASPSPSPVALPSSAAEGTVRRVVYSVGARQVWLVDPRKDPQVQAAFPVEVGTVSPTPGNYTVYSRAASANGADGRQIEHVVRFAQQGGVVFGFSAAVDGAAPAAVDPKAKTGGIRESRTDGQTLWDFAPTGTRVTVVA
ncbi:hypothetical protein GCM10009665_31500 [Kitasatospora nipponensis]|uniref:Secreted protein n=1 Tax=Kitasatospora nipponensis TaxID=258049 RepID=A0ABN1W790_9ACTN